MSAVVVRPVCTRAERRAFLAFPWRIFRDDPLWVPPLLPDWADRIDPRKGIFFKRGEAEFFIAWRGGEPVGTICAAEDREMNAERSLRECVFGFCNFVDDYAVFEALISTAKAWAQARGLVQIAGPYNLDYEDSYGVLVEGRDRPPVMLCGHTPPYYLPFYERAGFRPVRGDNIAFALDLNDRTPGLEELSRAAQRVRERGRFVVRPGNLNRWEEELERIYLLLNGCMRHLPDYRPWPREVVYNNLAPFRKIADPDLILFLEDSAQGPGCTVGCLPGLPDLNEAFIHAGGLRRPWDYARLLWHMRRPRQCLAVKTVLVLPEYWGSGGAFLLFDEMVKRARAKGYRWIDGSLTSEDNPRTPALGARFGARIYKRYRVFQMPV